MVRDPRWPEPKWRRRNATFTLLHWRGQSPVAASRDHAQQHSLKIDPEHAVPIPSFVKIRMLLAMAGWRCHHNGAAVFSIVQRSCTYHMDSIHKQSMRSQQVAVGAIAPQGLLLRLLLVFILWYQCCCRDGSHSCSASRRDLLRR